MKERTSNLILLSCYSFGAVFMCLYSIKTDDWNLAIVITAIFVALIYFLIKDLRGAK